MEIEATYVTTQHMHKRSAGEITRHEGMVEIYAPALGPDEWFIIKVWALIEGAGRPSELHTIIVKR